MDFVYYTACWIIQSSTQWHQSEDSSIGRSGCKKCAGNEATLRDTRGDQFISWSTGPSSPNQYRNVSTGSDGAEPYLFSFDETAVKTLNIAMISRFCMPVLVWANNQSPKTLTTETFVLCDCNSFKIAQRKVQFPCTESYQSTWISRICHL